MKRRSGSRRFSHSAGAPLSIGDRFRLALAVLAFVPFPAQAQSSPTPANAQLFLQRIVEKRNATGWFTDWNAVAAPQQPYTYCRIPRQGVAETCVTDLTTSYAVKLSDFTIASTCTSRLGLAADHQQIENTINMRRLDDRSWSTRYVLEGTSEPFDLTIDWSKVKLVRESGYGGLEIVTPEYTIHLLTEETELWPRLVYAATVLKDACDPAEGLGF